MYGCKAHLLDGIAFLLHFSSFKIPVVIKPVGIERAHVGLFEYRYPIVIHIKIKIELI